MHDWVRELFIAERWSFPYQTCFQMDTVTNGKNGFFHHICNLSTSSVYHHQMVLYYIEQDHHIGGTKLAKATLHTQSQTTPITTTRNGYMCAWQHNIIMPHKMKTQRKFKYGSEHLAKPSEILSATNFFSLSRKLGFIIVEKIPWKFGWHPHSISHCFHYHWTPTTSPSLPLPLPQLTTILQMAQMSRFTLAQQTQKSWGRDAILGRFISKSPVELFLLRHCITELNEESKTALHLGSRGLVCCSLVRPMKSSIPMSTWP